MSKNWTHRYFEFLNPTYTTAPKRSYCISRYKLPPSLEKREKCYYPQIRDITRVSHVIIDLDSVILNAKEYTVSAHEDYLMKWKKHLKSNLRFKIIGMRNKDVGKIVTKEFKLPFNENVYAHGVWQIQRALYHKVKLVRGAEELLCYFHDQRIPIALISNSHHGAFKILYSKFKLSGLDKHVCHSVYGDEVADGKPEPEILLKAARRFYKGPSDFSKYLLIDGGHSGAVAAKALDMQVALVTDPTMPKDMQDIATSTIHDIREFDPTEFKLPAKRMISKKKK